MDRRLKAFSRTMRGDHSFASIKAKLFPNPELVKDCQRELPQRYGGDGGRALLEYEFLNHGAISLLHGAEDYLCPIRVSVLIDVADMLDPEALPTDFFQRLVIMQKKIVDLGRKRPRTIERDRNMRQWWRGLRGNTVYRQFLASKGEAPDYAEAVTQMAEAFGRSEKSIEAITGRDEQEDLPRDRERDFKRLEAAIAKRYPKKSGPTSR